MVDGIFRNCQLAVYARAVSCVVISVIHREATAGDLQTDLVSGSEVIAGISKIDCQAAYLTRLKQMRLERVVISCPHDPLRNIESLAIRLHVKQTAEEIRVRRGGCMVLSPYRHCILMSTQNPLAAREKVSLNDVREEQFVFVSPTTQRMPPGYRMCQALGFSPKVVCLSDERSIMLALLKNSNFVSVVPEQDALSFVQLGGFAAFPVEGPAERSIIINFEVSRVRPMTAVCREFLCFLLDDPNIRAMNPQLDLSKV